MLSRIPILIYLQITTISMAPTHIFQAKPQIMMHTLQQPSPVENMHSLKAQKLHQDLQASTRIQQMMITNLQQLLATKTLQELGKIQAMQYTQPSAIEMQQIPMFPQMPIENMYPPTMVPWQTQDKQHVSVPPTIQQMTQDAMQEIALQQQMLSLQQMQTINQLNTVHSPYTFSQPEPFLVLLPDDKVEHKLYKNANENENKDKESTEAHGHEDENFESVIFESPNETEAHNVKGMRKAILFIPNARFSIGGVISQIPWLPVEVNVPDTAIWAWNGIYNGISSIISIIGSRVPWRPTPQNNPDATTKSSVKAFLKNLQEQEYGDYGAVVPAYPIPSDLLDTVIPVNFN